MGTCLSTATEGILLSDRCGGDLRVRRGGGCGVKEKEKCFRAGLDSLKSHKLLEEMAFLWRIFKAGKDPLGYKDSPLLI